MTRSLASGLVFVLASLSIAGCGNNDEPYKPAPAWSGRKANVPPVPQLPSTPMKTSDGAFTIYGASHHLKSRIHDKEVTSKDITITGVIVETNIPNAPACAIHPTGKKDLTEDCNAEIPSFWIADSADSKQKIRVVGLARNFAVIYDAVTKYKGLKEAPKELVKDDQLNNIEIPFPIPNTGAKVKITGKYGYTASVVSTGLVSDPQNGVIKMSKLEYIEPPKDAVVFANKK